MPAGNGGARDWHPVGRSDIVGPQIFTGTKIDIAMKSMFPAIVLSCCTVASAVDLPLGTPSPTSARSAVARLASPPPAETDVRMRPVVEPAAPQDAESPRPAAGRKSVRTRPAKSELTWRVASEEPEHDSSLQLVPARHRVAPPVPQTDKPSAQGATNVWQRKPRIAVRATDEETSTPVSRLFSQGPATDRTATRISSSGEAPRYR